MKIRHMSLYAISRSILVVKWSQSGVFDVVCHTCRYLTLLLLQYREGMKGGSIC